SVMAVVRARRLWGWQNRVAITPLSSIRQIMQAFGVQGYCYQGFHQRHAARFQPPFALPILLYAAILSPRPRYSFLDMSSSERNRLTLHIARERRPSV